MRPSAKTLLMTLATTLALCGAAAAGPATVLYDGALGTPPGSQDWLYLEWPLVGASVAQTANPTFTRLDTTAVVSDMAGYFARLDYAGPPAINYRHPDLPDLDRNAGYRVRFDAQIQSESHDNDDRAGLSMIVLSDDLLGIELGFWEDQVWAQSGPGFTKAESVALDTTAGMIQYDLEVSGNQYRLLAGGSEVLTGALRDYSSAASGTDPLRAVYGMNNFLFLGDDTESALASFDLALVSIQTGTAVPEPSTLVLAATGLMVLLAAGCRHRRRRGN